ncbi:MAG: hypothetical protein KKD48_01110 [Nanoarchaeota archaeon]|nr:hypothetical protein [Nanoarchaeota archaeon]
MQKEAYLKFKLTDLPPNEFVVLLKPEIQKRLINNAVIKFAKQTGNWGKYKQLAIYLYKKCKSFKSIKPDSLWDSYLFNWQKSKIYIPLDCVLELYKLTNQELKKGDAVKILLNLLKNRELTNPQIFNFLHKDYTTINKQLLEGINKGLINRNTNCWPYKYYATEKGLDLIDKEMVS